MPEFGSAASSSELPAEDTERADAALNAHNSTPFDYVTIN
jgi:hypothetical protein